MKMKLIPILLASFILIQYNSQQNLEKPPLTKIKPVEYVYFEEKVTDPYRYMENLEDSTVKKWMKEQAEYASSVLAKIPGHNNLLKRIQEFEDVTISKIGRDLVRLSNGKMFNLKRLASKNVYKLYMSNGWDGVEKLPVDTETLVSQLALLLLQIKVKKKFTRVFSQLLHNLDLYLLQFLL